MSWIDDWASNQVYINDPQLRNIDICRSLEYYVDPDGDEIVELGTKQYPYKNIALPFIEILNFHSHTDRIISIYLKEYTTSYIMQGKNFIINMTMVKIESYTDSTVLEASSASLFGVDYDLTIFSPVTVMNLIVDGSLKLDEAIAAADGLLVSETNALSTTDTNIHLLRTNLYMDKVNLYRDTQADSQKQTQFIKPIYLQEKNVTMKNFEVQTTGFILNTVDPMSMLIENIDIDYHAMMGGFIMKINCNYPEAYLYGNIKIDNMTLVNRQTRVAPILEGLIVHIGPENLTVTNSYITIYGSLAEDRSIVIKRLILNTWNADIEDVQQVEVSNTYWSLPENPFEDRFNSLFSNFDASIIRRVHWIYDGNVHEYMDDAIYPNYIVATHANTEIFLRNNIHRNLSNPFGIVETKVSKSVVVENEYIEYIDEFRLDAYAFFFTDSVDIRNITFNNINGTGSSVYSYIFADVNDGGYVNLDEIYIQNSNVALTTGFSVRGVLNSLSITNSIFSDLSIGTSTILLNTGEINKLYVSNLTFTNVNDQTADDQDNFMMMVDAIVLQDYSELSINDIVVETSGVGFLKFNSISGSISTQLNFNMTNIEYRNWYLETSKDLILFDNVESQEDFNFTIDGLGFNNMTFLKQSNLLFLKQQLLNQLVFKNSNFEDIESGVISIESANKQTLQYETKIKFENTTFTNIAAKYGSLILINEGGNLEISESTFSDVYSFEKGAVLFAGFQRTTTTVYNSDFSNCTSLQGGVFNLESEGLLRMHDSRISRNFAVISGVFQASDSGYYELFNCTIFENYALSSSVSQVFDVANIPVIDSSIIYDNPVLSINQLEEELTGTWNYLCFIKDDFKQFLINNPDQYKITASKRLFQLISANLQFRNGTTIYNEGAIIDSFISTLILSDSQFYNLTTSFSAFTVTSTTMNVENWTMYDISSNDNLALFTVTLNSVIGIEDVIYYNSTVPFITCLNSDANITSLSITNIAASSIIVNFDQLKTLRIENWNLDSIFSSSQHTPFSIQFSEVQLMRNITLKNINQSPLKIYTTNIENIQELLINNSFSGLTVEDSKIMSFSNSQFMHLGSSSIRQGGAILSVNSSMTINNMTFMNNTASEGGAVYYSCLEINPCIMNISDSSFINNVGITKGGAIRYDVYRPLMRQNIFENNTAQYGPNIASYPIQIKLTNSESDSISFDNVGSGIRSDIEFTLGLYDHDEQIMNLDSSSQIQIRTINTNNSDLGGTTSVKVNQGEAIFDEVTFISDPGNTNILFDLDSPSIDKTILEKQYGTDFTQEDINVNFRFWKPGEIFQDGIWRECSPGTYSLKWNSTECKTCIENVECEGKYIINVDKGYWRKDQNTTFIAECPNEDACLGGYNTLSEHPVYCEQGYDGYLWSDWVKVNNDKYERLADFEWSKWPDPVLNAIRVVGVAILIIIFMVGLIVVNIRKKKESQVSVLMRILTNYLQIMTATMAYSMRFPKMLEDLFIPVSRLGSSGETMMSYDCFASDANITLFLPSSPIAKNFMIALLPLMLLIGTIWIWALLHFILKKYLDDYKRNVVVSMITILFLLHPTLTEVALGMFQCIQIDEDDYKVRIDLNIDWYSGEHILWCLFIAFPMIIFWVIGCPTFVLFVLIRNRENLDEPKVQRYFIVLYQGLKKDKFYWEFVNTLRKVLIVWVNVFLAQYDSFYKGILAVVLIIILFRVQLVLMPYKDEEVNECEYLSFLSSAMTLYGGLLFINDEERGNDVVELIAFILIVLVNARFFILWMYLMSKTQQKYRFVTKITSTLRILLWKKRENQGTLNI